MSAVLSRTLVLLALVPVAACDLYFRSSEGDDVVGPDVDASNVRPDARPDIDAAVPIDGPPTPPPNPGFVTPTSTTRANVRTNGAWNDVGPADWSCLQQPPSEVVPPGGYTLTGSVRDYATNQSVGGVAIAASAAGTNGPILGSATSSTGAGSRGTYRLDLSMLPPETKRVRFALSIMGAPKTVVVDRYLGQLGIATLDLPQVSDATARSLPGFVGEAPDADAGEIVGELRDCQGRQVSGAIIALSTSPQFVVHWTGGVTYYFSAGGQSIPVRHDQRTETNRDGRFMLIGPTPMAGAEGTVQAFGFMTDADRANGALKPLGTSRAVVETATVSSVQIGRTRGLGTAP